MAGTGTRTERTGFWFTAQRTRLTGTVFRTFHVENDNDEDEEGGDDDDDDIIIIIMSILIIKLHRPSNLPKNPHDPHPTIDFP